MNNYTLMLYRCIDFTDIHSQIFSRYFTQNKSCRFAYLKINHRFWSKRIDIIGFALCLHYLVNLNDENISMEWFICDLYKSVRQSKLSTIDNRRIEHFSPFHINENKFKCLRSCDMRYLIWWIDIHWINFTFRLLWKSFH